MLRFAQLVAGLMFMGVCISGCAPNEPDIIIITATFPPVPPSAASPTPPQTTGVDATDIAPPQAISPGATYAVQPGDTLSSIAEANGITTQALAEMNEIENPDFLAVGQTLILPAPPSESTPNQALLSNERFLASNTDFDLAGFIAAQPGYIREATDLVDMRLADGSTQEELLSAAEVIQRVSLEFSVDERLLLALLEYRSGWLSRTELSEETLEYPMGQVEANRDGLYRQLAWTADQLNFGYYGWRYRGLDTLTIPSGERLSFEPQLNAATVGLQYFLSLNSDYPGWQQDVSPDGFFELYVRYFGDPFIDTTDAIVPTPLSQPVLEFPFSSGEVWFFTGGPHGGWGRGSAWAALDFAPPDDLPAGSAACYTSQFAATAAAPGIIARSERGSVILDLDGDGDEFTGWTLLYLHIASAGRIPAGTQVDVGDVIGYPSCEGGFSNATHMHFARRYNGEWIPAFCHECAPTDLVPPLQLSEWETVGLKNQEYQGYMVRGGEQRRAEQGRLIPDNRLSR